MLVTTPICALATIPKNTTKTVVTPWENRAHTLANGGDPVTGIVGDMNFEFVVIRGSISTVLNTFCRGVEPKIWPQAPRF